MYNIRPFDIRRWADNRRLMKRKMKKNQDDVLVVVAVVAMR